MSIKAYTEDGEEVLATLILGEDHPHQLEVTFRGETRSFSIAQLLVEQSFDDLVSMMLYAARKW